MKKRLRRERPLAPKHRRCGMGVGLGEGSLPTPHWGPSIPDPADRSPLDREHREPFLSLIRGSACTPSSPENNFLKLSTCCSRKPVFIFV